MSDPPLQVHEVLPAGGQRSDARLEHRAGQEGGLPTGPPPTHLPGRLRQGLPLQEGLRPQGEADVQKSLLMSTSLM